MLETLEKRNNETAREYAIRSIQDNIINMNLKPGQAVSENEIAEALGMSRTPVREAFIELSKLSMVEIFPQKGTYISLIDLDLVEESRFIRCIIEKALVRQVCNMISESYLSYLDENLLLQESCVVNKNYKRLLAFDNDFHELLFKACNKERTYQFIKGMMLHFDRVRILNLAEMDPQKTVDEHKNLLKAIKEKDEKRATDLMEQHLSRVTLDQSYLREIHPQYFK